VSNTPPEWDNIKQHALEKAARNESVDWFEKSILAPVDIFQLGLLLFYLLTEKGITVEIWEECKGPGFTATQRPDAKEKYKERVRCIFFLIF